MTPEEDLKAKVHAKSPLDEGFCCGFTTPAQRRRMSLSFVYRLAPCESVVKTGSQVPFEV